MSEPAASQPSKSQRQRMIADWVRSERIGSQDELVARLAGEGVSATQATVSRDLDELGALRVRRDGGAHYVLGGEADIAVTGSRLDRLLSEWVDSILVSGNLLILRTPPGSANLVANAIDRAAMPDVAGTIAGDDTIFVALSEGVNGHAAAERLRLRRSAG